MVGSSGSWLLGCFVLFWSAYGIPQKLESGDKVELIDGVEFIHNTETPIFPDKTVTFVEVLSLS